MPSVPSTLSVELPLDLVAQLGELGDGDPVAGVRVAVLAAQTLTPTGPSAPSPEARGIAQLLRAAAAFDTRSAELLRLITRYELERSTWLDDVARLADDEENPA